MRSTWHDGAGRESGRTSLVTALGSAIIRAGRRPSAAIVRLATVAGCGLAAGACNARFGAPEPASRQGAPVLDLWRILFLTGLALGVVVVALIGWSVVRYRRRDGGEAAGFSEHVRLELFYTAVPLAIVAVLFGITMGVQRNVTRLAAEPDLRIEVTGFQWGWRFQYLTEGITIVGTNLEPPTMVLPLGATARLVLRSPDVVHSFYVPEFLEKRDLVPGIENRIDVTPSRLGTFNGACAEYCGLHHAAMTFAVEVLSPEDFRAFVEERQQEQEQGTTPPGTRGGGNDPGGQALREPALRGPRGPAPGPALG